MHTLGLITKNTCSVELIINITNYFLLLLFVLPITYLLAIRCIENNHVLITSLSLSFYSYETYICSTFKIAIALDMVNISRSRFKGKTPFTSLYNLVKMIFILKGKVSAASDRKQKGRRNKEPG